MIRRFTSAQFVPADAGSKDKNPMGSAVLSTPIIAPTNLDRHQILRNFCHESVRKGLMADGLSHLPVRLRDEGEMKNAKKRCFRHRLGPLPCIATNVSCSDGDEIRNRSSYSLTVMTLLLEALQRPLPETCGRVCVQ